jgi:hypothetical protein
MKCIIVMDRTKHIGVPYNYILFNDYFFLSRIPMSNSVLRFKMLILLWNHQYSSNYADNCYINACFR